MVRRWEPKPKGPAHRWRRPPINVADLPDPPRLDESDTPLRDAFESVRQFSQRNQTQQPAADAASNTNLPSTEQETTTMSENNNTAANANAEAAAPTTDANNAAAVQTRANRMRYVKLFGKVSLIVLGVGAAALGGTAAYNRYKSA